MTTAIDPSYRHLANLAVPSPYAALAELLKSRPSHGDYASKRAAWLFEIADAYTAAGQDTDADVARTAGLDIVRACVVTVTGTR